MATFVLVHGGGHGGWCYRFVVERLRALGHKVYAPSLTGLADRAHLMSATIDLDTHITDIVNLLRFEDLRDVVLVGHSYGGMVVTGIADRAADRIGHLVYLDAANPEDGQSLVDVAGPMMAMAQQMGQVVDGVELVQLPTDDSPIFYGVTDPALVEWMRPRLTPQPWKCFEQKLILTDAAALAAIPQSHIVCTATIPGRDMAGLRARHGGRVWDIDTGHDLMITEPERVTDLLVRAAQSPAGPSEERS